jgi:hypothetical protein
MPVSTFRFVRVAQGKEMPWGTLVKHWALNPQDWPADLQQLQSQFNGEVLLENLDLVTSLVIVQQPRNVLVIHLPSADLVEETERELRKDHAEYLMPPFYEPAFPNGLFSLPLPDARADFQTMRIGEYSIANCM